MVPLRSVVRDAAAPAAGLLPGELLRQVRRLEIRTRALVDEVFAGQYHSVFKGRGMEFAEVREYVPGDDIRTIDWNVTARYGAPFVKKYVEERELTVFLMVDASASQSFGSADRAKLELAAEIAALLAFSAINNQDRVGLQVFSDRTEHLVPPRRSRSHGLRLVREILGFRPEGKQTDIAEACRTAYHALRRRSVVFLISDFLAPPEGFGRALGSLAARHDLIAASIEDPMEQNLPAAGLLATEDLETGHRRLIDSDDPRVRERIHAAFREHREGVAALLRRRGVDQIRLVLGEDPVTPLLNFFRLRERRLARE